MINYNFLSMFFLRCPPGHGCHTLQEVNTPREINFPADFLQLRRNRDGNFEPAFFVHFVFQVFIAPGKLVCIQ